MAAALKKASEDGHRESPLPLVFDTSILAGLSVDRPSPEFRLILGLAGAGKAKLLVPEMALREWLDRLVRPAAEAVDDLHDAIQTFATKRGIAHQPIATDLAKLEIVSEQRLADAKEAARAWHEAIVKTWDLSCLEISSEDWQAVVNGYFTGSPPFSARKARHDIPDALVLTGVLKTYDLDDRTVFVCDDKNLRKAAKESGVSTAATLVDLLRLPAVAQLHSDADFALWWEENLAVVVGAIRNDEALLTELLENELVNAVASSEIVHGSIPEDNSEAWVWSVGHTEVVEVDWDSAESLGEGLLSVPLAFEAEVELEFGVYRGDAFCVPDWVNVTIGDFEDDHYFTASGSRIARYAARLVLSFGPSVLDGAHLEDAEITIEDLDLDDLTDSWSDAQAD